MSGAAEIAADETAVILAGDDGVPLRVREELAGAGVPTVSICSSQETIAAAAATAAGATVVIGDPASPATWDRAGLSRARSIGVLGADDLQNLSSALLAGGLREEVPIVLRLFSSDLATGVKRMLGERATVLSETEVAAPSFVQAAISGNTGQRVKIAGRVLEVAEVDPEDPALVLALCAADTPTDVLPSRDRFSTSVLGLVDPQAVVVGTRGALPGAVARQRPDREPDSKGTRRRRASRRERAHAALAQIPRRAWLLVGAMLATASVSAIVFGVGADLGAIDAIYFTATTMATVGYGDINLLNRPEWLKIYAVALMTTSVVLSAGLLAFVTDMIISTRIERALGRFPKPRRDHVIVCGLGKAGSQIIAGLHDLDVPCVGVEQHEDAVGIAVARNLEIPVVLADARTPGILEELHVGQAKAVLAVTNDDLANLQCGLAANEHNPEVRVVLRIFDSSLAERLDHTSELDLTRSVSALAAPVFAAALLGRRLSEALPLSNVPLRVVEGVIGASAPVIGRLVRDLHLDGGMRVLSLDGRWRPRDDTELQPGMTIAAVGTRRACEELLGAV